MLVRYQGNKWIWSLTLFLAVVAYQGGFIRALSSSVTLFAAASALPRERLLGWAVGLRTGLDTVSLLVAMTAAEDTRLRTIGLVVTRKVVNQQYR